MQGHAWCSDYGNPDTLEGFEWVYPYSPLHNVRRPTGGSRQYPAMLITTGVSPSGHRPGYWKAIHLCEV